MKKMVVIIEGMQEDLERLAERLKFSTMYKICFLRFFPRSQYCLVGFVPFAVGEHVMKHNKSLRNKWKGAKTRYLNRW